MGWFDEQIKERKKSDNDLFEDSFINIAGSIMGSGIAGMLNDERQIAKNAIESVLKYYGVKPREIPDNVREFEDQLEFLLRPNGIMYREVRLTENWYEDAIGAMLTVRRSDETPIALIPHGVRGYVFLDPKTGKQTKVTKENRDDFEEAALVFYKPFPLRKINVLDLIRYIGWTISKNDVAIAVIITLMVTLTGMLLPKINNIIFSKVIVSESYRALMGIAVFLVCVSLSLMLFNTAKTVVISRLNTKMQICVESAAMMRLLSLPAGFFKRFGAGELSAKMSYLNNLCSMLMSSVFSTALSGVFSLIYIGQIFKYAKALVVPSIIIILITVITSTVTVLLQMRIRKEQMELSAKESGMSFALISGIQKIRLSGSEKRAFARWGNLYAKEAKLDYDPPLLLKIAPVISTGITLLGAVLLDYLAVKNGVAVAEYYAFQSAYGMVSGAFSALAGIGIDIAQIKPVIDQVSPILDEVPEISEGKQMVTKLSGGIELNNISFRYNENMPLVLDDLSLRIRPGQYIAIVGKTGCGKSTLMRLLLGFEKPQKGAIYYDGKDINSLDLKSLRRSIGAVTQNGKLFQGDIYENIVISAPGLTVDDAWEAAEMAGMADDIREMPMGMFTMISEGSGGISGGQKQRLMIARAVAPKPKILMFDEATSALDNITQKKVADSLKGLKCTRIVIAHRLSTIKDCDRIIVLDGGKIIEDGTYDELIEADGFFAELVQRQRLDA
ncbi:MAG: NHLP bacteriocin export ABC transporter permease/ATPase subunit [Lachnospiraceae bacterium]|nr:NHLP bacteriocin export ABC transporter permease/ATPase subunit [Lachnospiraceae bacterium]